MKHTIIKTQHLKKYYQVSSHFIKSLDGVDLEVKEREFVSIIGNHAIAFL